MPPLVCSLQCKPANTNVELVLVTQLITLAVIPDIVNNFLHIKYNETLQLLSNRMCQVQGRVTKPCLNYSSGAVWGGEDGGSPR